MGSDFQLISVFVSSLVFFVAPGLAALVSLFRHPEEFDLKKPKPPVLPNPLIRVRRHGSRPLETRA